MWYKAWLVLLTSSEFTSNTKNVISDTTKYCDKAALEGKRRQIVEAKVFLKCSIFIDILDSGKNFSLALQYKDIDIILLVERIDDMKLSYQLFANKSQASLESVWATKCKKIVNSNCASWKLWVLLLEYKT